MSATAQPSREQLSKEDRLKTFLQDKAADGEMYFKSKFIADEVGLSPKEDRRADGQTQGFGRTRGREVVVHERDHLARRIGLKPIRPGSPPRTRFSFPFRSPFTVRLVSDQSISSSAHGY